MKTSQLFCTHCQKEFNRCIAYGKYRKQTRYFCRQKCKEDYYHRIRPRQLVKFQCSHCQADVFRKPSEIKKCKSQTFYCSRLCSNRHLTHLTGCRYVPHQKKCYICQLCGSRTSYARKFCQICKENPEIKIPQVKRQKNCTLLELKSKTKYKSSKYSMVREDARKKLNPSSKECLICGYNKYVECCHIKPVQDFPETALLSEVNALTNICWLCPNHHKELDKQIMDIQLVKDKLNAKLMGEPRNDRDSSAYETVKMPHLPSPN